MSKWILALAFTAIAFAGDVTGRWSGSFDMTIDNESKPSTALLLLKQDGDKVTGTAGPDAEHQFPLRSGTLTGNKLKLEVDHPSGSPILMDLDVDGDHITGSAKGESDGRSLSAKLDLKREK